MGDPNITIPEEAFMAALDASSRALDNPPADPARAALEAAAPLLVAAELERLAARYRVEQNAERQRRLTLERRDAHQWQIESCSVSETNMREFAGALERRAAELRVGSLTHKNGGHP